MTDITEAAPRLHGRFLVTSPVGLSMFGIVFMSQGRVMFCASSLPLPLYDARRGRRVGELLAFVWLLSLSDLLFTLWAHTFTPFHELNPLARLLLRNDLLGTLVGMKLTFTLVGTGIFWRLRHLPQAEVAAWAVLLTYLALLMRWSTYTSTVIAML